MSWDQVITLLPAGEEKAAIHPWPMRSILRRVGDGHDSLTDHSLLLLVRLSRAVTYSLQRISLYNHGIWLLLFAW